MPKPGLKPLPTPISLRRELEFSSVFKDPYIADFEATEKELIAEFVFDNLPIKLYTGTVINPAEGDTDVFVHIMHKVKLVARAVIQLDQYPELRNAIEPLNASQCKVTRCLRDGRQTMQVVIPIRKKYTIAPKVDGKGRSSAAPRGQKRGGSPLEKVVWKKQLTVTHSCGKELTDAEKEKLFGKKPSARPTARPSARPSAWGPTRNPNRMLLNHPDGATVAEPQMSEKAKGKRHARHVEVSDEMETD